VTDATGRRLGSVLVALQFGLIGVLAWLAAPRFLAGRAPAAAWVLVPLAAAVGVWAVQANRPGNFNIHPAPREGGALVHHGPYRWIRHPMYTSVGGLAVACAMAAGSMGAALAAGLLGAVLLGKALLEERWMAERHPGYAAYRARTRRFVPGLF
jgi:protein-S-isoprenylcysteine O-methyltransferase Ste14